MLLAVYGFGDPLRNWHLPALVLEAAFGLGGPLAALIYVCLGMRGLVAPCIPALTDGRRSVFPGEQAWRPATSWLSLGGL